MSDSSDAESGIAGIETFITQTPEQGTFTLAGQDADILLNYGNTDYGKAKHSAYGSAIDFEA